MVTKGEFVSFSQDHQKNLEKKLPYEHRQIIKNAEIYENNLYKWESKVPFAVTIKKYFTYESDNPNSSIKNFVLIQHNNNDISLIFSLTTSDDDTVYKINYKVAKKLLFAGFTIPPLDSITGKDFKFYARLSIWGPEKMHKLIKMLCNFCIIENIELIKTIMDNFNIISNEFSDQSTNVLLDSLATEAESIEGLTEMSFVGHAEENREYRDKLAEMLSKRQEAKFNLTDRLEKLNLLN